MPPRPEDLNPDDQVTGLIGRDAVRTVSAQMMGEATNEVYRDCQANLQFQIQFRNRKVDLLLVAGSRPVELQGGWRQVQSRRRSRADQAGLHLRSVRGGQQQ